MTNKISYWKRYKDNYARVSKLSPYVMGDTTSKPESWHGNQKTLEQFVQQLSKELRGVKFTRRRDDSYWIYRDDNPYVMGWVGRGLNFLSTTTSDDYLFCVCARTINNWKYNDGSWQHYAKMSTRWDKAMKNAKTYLRVMSPHDMAYINEDRIVQSLSNVTRQEENKLGNLYKSLFNSVQESYDYIRKFKANRAKEHTVLQFMHKIYTEKRELLEDDPDFLKTYEDFLAQEQQLGEALKKQHKVYHIRVYEDAFKVRKFDVTFIGNAEGGTLGTSQPIEDMSLSPKVVLDDSTLPEDLLGKVSVLTMLDEGGFVDEVGYKIDSTMFYVITERDFHISSDTTR